MISPDYVVHRSSTVSRDSFDEEEGFSFSSSVAGEGKTPRKCNNAGATTSRRFRCLSTIGLPKRPDTKFRKQDFSGKLRSSISRRYQSRQSGPLFNGVPREAVLSAKRGNNSFKSYEPGSPNVSCLGRIKLKQKDGKGLRTKLKSLTTSRHEDRSQPQPSASASASATDAPQRRRFCWLKKWFSSRKKVDDSHRAAPAAAAVAAYFDGKDYSKCHVDDVEIEKSRVSPPTLAQMKRFTSQREPQALSDFSADDFDVETPDSQEWASETAGKMVEEDEGSKKMEAEPETDLERVADIVGVYKDMDFGVCFPYPPPADVNLWKRRSVAPPVALDLKPRHLGLDMRRPMTV